MSWCDGSKAGGFRPLRAGSDGAGSVKRVRVLGTQPQGDPMKDAIVLLALLAMGCASPRRPGGPYAAGSPAPAPAARPAGALFGGMAVPAPPPQPPAK